jgi:hypothetical protein
MTTQRSLYLRGINICVLIDFQAKCYVYLPDVSIRDSDESAHSPESTFWKTRWFTRGWTLQELIAPASVEFYSLEGIPLGDKRSLEQQIYKITTIPVSALRGDPLYNFSFEERISWSFKRRTTREEDKSYSLLGIFDIHMPLIYGEGEKKAFNRLLEEIQKSAKSESKLGLKGPHGSSCLRILPSPYDRR